MKAVLSKVVGGPETLVLEDIPAPELRPGGALVQVKAVGINFPDVLMIEDKYQSKPPRPFAPGGEVSGVVTAVAEGVTNVKVGDRVLAQIEAQRGMVGGQFWSVFWPSLTAMVGFCADTVCGDDGHAV